MQEHGRKYFAPKPLTTLNPDNGVSLVKIQHFYNILMLHNLLKKITNSVTW